MRARIGLLVPSTDIVMEADLWRRLPEGMTLHTARMHLEGTTVEGEARMIEEELIPAARRIASLKPGIVIFGCTSAAALYGLAGDRDIATKVRSIANCECVTVVQAVRRDLDAIAPERLLVLTPYVDQVNLRLESTLKEAGLNVVGVHGLGLDHDLLIGAIEPEEIFNFARQAFERSPISPDCLFISCTTFRAFDVAERLEDALGTPVVTSNRSVYRWIAEPKW